MKNFRFLFIVTFALLSFSGISPVCTGEETETLQGYVQKVPPEFFGTWRVCAKRIETDSPARFREKTVDLWNIIEGSDVIKLNNPFTGASAQLNITHSDGTVIEFSKKGKYDNQILTDTVKITIVGDNFTGTDTLKLDTLSEIDGSVIKSSAAVYRLTGEKIAGQSIIGE